MKTLLASITVLIITTAAWGNTDHQCVNDCTRQGYMYSFCKEKCSYGENDYERNRIERPKNVDHNCVHDCTKKGYSYSLCKEKCSY